jgi:hypothetical protein
MALKYLGTDPRTDWIPGVPSRDLSDEDITELGLDEAALAVSRLYEKQAAKAAPKGDN